jgi:hypothetical protein
MHKAGELEPILIEASKYGTFYSSVVGRQNAYGYEAFLRYAFVASPAPVATAAADWNTTDDTVTITGHAYVDGQVIQLTTSGGLPGGTSATTDYWIKKIDANTIKLASSQANLIAGTYGNITSQGTGNHTLTVQTNVATYVVETSPDGANYVAHDSMTAVSLVGSTMLHKHFESASMFFRIKVSVDKGNLSSVIGHIVSKG